jgi:hypothetical protein
MFDSTSYRSPFPGFFSPGRKKKVGVDSQTIFFSMACGQPLLFDDLSVSIDHSYVLLYKIHFLPFFLSSFSTDYSLLVVLRRNDEHFRNENER